MPGLTDRTGARLSLLLVSQTNSSRFYSFGAADSDLPIGGFLDAGQFVLTVEYIDVPGAPEGIDYQLDFECPTLPPTPSPTAFATPNPTPFGTSTPTPTASITPTPASTPTPGPTSTPELTGTPTQTPTPPPTPECGKSGTTPFGAGGRPDGGAATGGVAYFSGYFHGIETVELTLSITGGGVSGDTHFFLYQGPENASTLQLVGAWTGPTHTIQRPVFQDFDGRNSFGVFSTELLPGIPPMIPNPELSYTITCVADPTPTPVPTPFPTPTTNTDSDGDGFLDDIESTLGSDPNDPSSKPTFGDFDGNTTVDALDGLRGYRQLPLTYLPILDVNLDGNLTRHDAELVWLWATGDPTVPTLPHVEGAE